jgi:hypothetical protein
MYLCFWTCRKGQDEACVPLLLGRVLVHLSYLFPVVSTIDLIRKT